ncbi:MAG: acyltransferase [Syntrophobacterales bacterium]|jgi:acetyltransferase-like isoleucine patch superfamily enzyme
MMINAQSKRVIPFRPNDAKRVGKGCYYLDLIIWLNGEFIELGDDVGFNSGCWVNGFGGLTIGDQSMVGPYSMIHTANHETDPSKPLQEQGHIKAPVTIGKEVWIAMGVMILPGVTIGDGVIVGAGSVVTKDLPPWTLAVGNPCKVIKQRK